MEYNVYDCENEKLLFTLKVRSNSKWKTIINKTKEKLKEYYNYNEDFKMLSTGKVDFVTGKSDIKYVCFGIKKTIMIEETSYLPF